MASLAMATSFVGSTATIIERPKTATRKLAIVKAARAESQEAAKTVRIEEGNSSGRRATMFAAAAAVALSAISSLPVLAEDEPQAGTPEAKKKYGPICVTMPTARVCHK